MRLTGFMVTTIVLIRTSIALASGCDSGVDVRGALAKWRESRGKVTFSERRQFLDDLAAKHPDSFEVQTERLSWYRWNQPDAWPAVEQSYVRRAEQNSGD